MLQLYFFFQIARRYRSMRLHQRDAAHRANRPSVEVELQHRGTSLQLRDQTSRCRRGR